MYKFIKKIFVVLLFFMLITSVFDIWLRSQKLSYAAKYEGLIKAKDKVELIILGNSHANYGVNPSVFKNIYAYNLANVSQKIYQDKRIILKALSEYKFPKLKYVMINVDYHSLIYSSQEQRNLWSYYDLGIKYKDENYLLPNLSPFLWGYKPKVTFSFLEKHFRKKQKYLDSEYGVNPHSSYIKGFLAFEGTDNSRFNNKAYKERVASWKEDINNSERKEIVQDLRELITTLKNKGIKPILFSNPTYKDYNMFLDKNIINRNNHDISIICDEFKIKYLDFMIDKHFTKEHFYNEDHLNSKGAKLFTQMIITEMMNNGVISEL